MMVKINWFSEIKWLLIFIVFGASCQVEMTEDEKFERFAQQYEKTVVKIFPVEVKNMAIDSFISKDLSKVEILRKVEFCRENLDKLAQLDLQKISPTHTEELKNIFTELKAYLRDMEAAATKTK